MDKIAFSITLQDVEQLQATVKQAQKTNYKGEAYEWPEALLTENGSALDLLCTAFGLWTENQARESNIEYINEYESYYMENDIDYEKYFLKQLTKAQAGMYAKNLTLYRAGLAVYREQLQEQLKQGEWPEELQEELQEAIDSWYDSFFKEYLYGDRSNSGVVQILAEKIGGTVTYSKEDGSIGVEYEADPEATRGTKKDFLDTMKYKATSNYKEAATKATARRQEHQKQAEAREARRTREEQETIDRLQAI